MDSDHDLLWQYVEEIVTYFKCKFQYSRTRTCFKKSGERSVLPRMFLGQRLVSGRTHQLIGSFCKTELNSDLLYGGLEI